MQNGASTGAVGSAMDLEPDVGALMANLPRFSVIPSLDPYGQTPLRVTSPTSSVYYNDNYCFTHAPSTRRSKQNSLAYSVRNRECGGPRICTPRSILEGLCSDDSSTYQIYGNDEGSPPFSLKFGRSKRAACLVVADEEGSVSIIDSSKSKSQSNVCSWSCHRNAIFDVAIADGDDLLATASGDQTIKLWDLSSHEPVEKMMLRGHKSSVKSVQFRPGSQQELVSGAREGSIFLWDARVKSDCCSTRSQGETGRAVKQITDAHAKRNYTNITTSPRRKSKDARNQSSCSVTSVVFINDYILASAGDNDGSVKFWDLRRGWTSRHTFKPTSFLSREASATGRPRGITSLSVNNSNSKILASSSDSHIYMFDCLVPEREPSIYSGHFVNSFYVKASFSPDCRYIISGSSDFHVYIWDVNNPLLPPMRLRGHTGEVSDVAWSQTEFWKLASSSDDTTVRLWTIDRELSEHFSTEGAEGDSELLSPHSSRYSGLSEVPRAWSHPASREEDLLTCHEVMMFTDTCSSEDSLTPRKIRKLRPIDCIGLTRQSNLDSSRSQSGSPTLWKQSKLEDFYSSTPISRK